MGKKSLFIVFIILCLCIFFGCSGNFDKLVIVCDDVSDIAEGEYTLVYSIKDYEKLATKYNLTIKVKAFDQENVEVPVKNNRTITVQKDYVYTIVVYCSTVIKDETVTKNKQFVVTGEKSPPSVNFILKYESSTSLHETITLEYDESISLSRVPTLPNWYPNYVEGIQKNIISKKWVVYVDGTEHDLEQSHLNNIKSTINVYGVYTYEIVYTDIYYHFNSNGGSEVSSISGKLNNSINRPQQNPTKEGFTFDCWYTDSSLELPYNWKENTIFRKSQTLYAKWIEQTGNHTDFDYFDFNELIDDNYNKYYAIKAKESANLQGILNLPSGYNNIPIKSIDTQGFQNSAITSVYIPNSIVVFGQNSFEGCTSLAKVEFQEGNNMEILAWYSFKNCTSLSTISNLPQSITSLGSQTFMNCSSLASFTIPSGVQVLQTDVFNGCASLTSIDIPDSVIDILNGAFKDCTSLTNIRFTIHSQLEAINPSAVTDTAVTDIVLPHFFLGKNPFASTAITVTYYDAPPKED